MSIYDYKQKPFTGLVGIGDFSEKERPDDIFNTILRLWPNGSSIITGMSALFGADKMNDVVHHWYINKLPNRGGTLTAGSSIYRNSDLSTAYDATISQGVTGDRLYVKMGITGNANDNDITANVNEFRKGLLGYFRDSTDSLNNVRFRVIDDPVLNGANSYITVELLEDDDNGQTFDAGEGSITHRLETCNEIWITASSHGQAGMPPSSTNYSLKLEKNVSQIYKETAELSRTAQAVRSRVFKNVFQERKRQAWENYTRSVEEGLLWGVYDDTGVDPDTGQPRTTHAGFFSLMEQNMPGHIYDYRTDPDFAGLPWNVGGDEFLDKVIEETSLEGASEERLWTGGNFAMKGIEKLAKQNGQIMLEGKTLKYGIKVQQWISSLQDIYFKRHPLFNMKPSMRNTMISINPANIKRLDLRPTMGEDVTPKGFDGMKHQYIGELSWRMTFFEQMAIIHGIGQDNVLPTP